MLISGQTRHCGPQSSSGPLATSTVLLPKRTGHQGSPIILRGCCTQTAGSVLALDMPLRSYGMLSRLFTPQGDDGVMKKTGAYDYTQLPPATGASHEAAHTVRGRLDEAPRLYAVNRGEGHPSCTEHRRPRKRVGRVCVRTRYHRALHLSTPMSPRAAAWHALFPSFKAPPHP
jgi:hypothetical protein